MPPRRIDDTDRSISSLGTSDDQKARVAKWVKWVEDLNVRDFCAQGTVGVGVIIPTFITSSLAAVSVMMDTGVLHAKTSWSTTSPSLSSFGPSSATN